ncbi:MAG: magnesium/cobalt transporter CorA [Anaerolineaceae bacterium]|nr:magnesium/cobalt transporter CorA [Anaerolineaceae bacterium]
MIRNICWTADGQLKTNLSLDEVQNVLLNPKSLLWVDICDEPYDESQRLLKEDFKFHPLSIADALEETHIPKVDNWGEYLYLVLRAINPDQDLSDEITTDELDVFIGDNFMVTYHPIPHHAVDRTWQWVLKDGRIANEGSAALLYRLLDEMADDFISMADQIDLILNGMEDQLFDNPDASLLEDLFTYKRGLLHLRQIIGPQREVLNKLARGDFKILGDDAKMYFRDIYDHFLRLYEVIENLRDLTGSTLDIYLSVVNNRMNSVMKTLTIITTLFMPISFLAGFFGMNFFKPGEGMDVWTSGPLFYVVLIVMVLFPVAMILYINHKGWLK